VDGNLKMLLGMCWVLLRHFGKRHSGAKDDGSSFEESMLKWIQQEVAGYNLEVTNFKTSFNDGKVFLALNHKLYPDSVDYHSRDMSNHADNSELAFKISEDRLRVPTLLNSKNLAAGTEKEKSIVLYISLLYNAYINETDKRKLAGFSETKTLSLQEQIAMLEEEIITLNERNTVLTEKVDVLQKLIDEETGEKTELKQSKDDSFSKIKQEREQLKEATEKLAKEKGSMVSENEELMNQLRNSQKQREKLEEILSSAKKESKNSSLLDLEKALSVQLKHMNAWKGHFKTPGKEYQSDKVQLSLEKEISKLDPFDQLATIAQSLAHEELKLKVLRKEIGTTLAKDKETIDKSLVVDSKKGEKKKK